MQDSCHFQLHYYWCYRSQVKHQTVGRVSSCKERKIRMLKWIILSSSIVFTIIHSADYIFLLILWDQQDYSVYLGLFIVRICFPDAKSQIKVHDQYYGVPGTICNNAADGIQSDIQIWYLHFYKIMLTHAIIIIIFFFLYFLISSTSASWRSVPWARVLPKIQEYAEIIIIRVSHFPLYSNLRFYQTFLSYIDKRI